jgi:hypothetical protein
MKLNVLAGAALASALLSSAPGSAAREPSQHVRCDGNPDNVTAGETAARLVGAVTLLGLFAPSPEAPDASQRLSGAEGVTVCGTVLATESNDVRRAQLILATAIHHIEAGNFEPAIVEARRAMTDRPAMAGTAPFRRSLALAAMEIEAMALLGLGRDDEARAKAFEMAASAPYDLVTQLRASRYARTGGSFGAAEQQFFDNALRQYPLMLAERATARAMAGDFRGAVVDYETWSRLAATLSERVDMTSLAYRALYLALVGEREQAEALAREARTAMEADADSTAAGGVGEVLDLYQILRTGRDGRMAEARLLFANRASWQRTPSAAVAEVARILSEGASPSERTGLLAGDPARFRTELLDRRRREILDDKERFTIIRPFASQANYDRFSGNVWRDGRSRYFSREDNEQLKARFISVARDGYGAPAGYALLLHAALIARAEGKTHFMLMPTRSEIYATMVRFGNAADPGMVVPLAFEAERVVADLGSIIPRPVR